MHAAHNEYFVHLKNKLEAAPYMERASLVQDACNLLGCSMATAYRKLEAVGFTSGRKPRKDCGTVCVPAELARTAAGMIIQATRANDKKTLPLTTVCSILEENGMGVVDKETGKVTMPSPTTVARAMRLHGCHPTQVAGGTPAVELRSLHPNHVWQVDASVCVLFYLPKGKVKVLDERVVNAKKPQNMEKIQRERVVRWIITDHTSANFFLLYTQGSENAATAIEVLIQAMMQRGETDLMHGAPRILFTDPGPAFNCNLTRAFLQRLNIQFIPHKPGSARATGLVENTQNLVETQFEGRLRFLTITNLEELNAQATKWRLAWLATALHSRHGTTRNRMWLTITEDQLRKPASLEALREVVSTPPEPRKVTPKLQITYAPKGYKSLTYSLRHIEGITIGGQVHVAVNPYYAPSIDLIVSQNDGTESIYTLEPIERDGAGFDVNAAVIGQSYASHADTSVDKAVKTMEREAYGATTAEEAAAAKKAGQKPYAHINVMADVEAVKAPTYFPRRGRDLALETQGRELPSLTPVEVAMQLRPVLAAHGITWGPEHLGHIKQTYGAIVPGEAVEELAAHFIAAAQPPAVVEAPTLRIVGGAA